MISKFYFFSIGGFSLIGAKFQIWNVLEKLTGFFIKGIYLVIIMLEIIFKISLKKLQKRFAIDVIFLNLQPL